MKFNNKKKFGFTLIELLVVFSISALIATIMMASYPNFTSSLEFENAALDIALIIREAQVYGVSSFLEESTGSFDVPYGVNFNMSNSNSFILFADIVNANNMYDSGEEIKTIYIKDTFKINNICIHNGLCYSLSTFWNPLNITFKRPTPDAVIKLNNVSGNLGYIEIENKKNGNIKKITVRNTGQISVE